MTALLDAVELEKDFKGVRAVNRVNLSVSRGETLGLVGESGCGKSTTAKLLLRLLDADGGTIRFEGSDVTHKRGRSLREFRSKVQVVPQNPQTSLNPRITVRSSIEFNMRVHGIAASERRSTIANLLDRVGLDQSHGERYPHELSGGQLQRAAIARALATKPDLIICDEAVSALDKSVQAQVLNLLVELQQDLGVAYIFISHDLAVIEHLSDRIAVMYLGKIVEEGVASSLLEAPRHPYTQALFSAIPGMHGERIRLRGDLPRPSEVPPGCPFSSRCPEAEPCCSERPPPLRQAPPNGPGDTQVHRVACIHVPEPPADSATRVTNLNIH